MRKKIIIMTYIMVVSFSGFVSAASSKSNLTTKQPNKARPEPNRQILGIVQSIIL